MSIVYEDKTKEFTLATARFVYLFYINQFGIPVHLFCGPKTISFDRKSVIQPDIWNDYRYYENGKEVAREGDGYIMEKTPSECASYGRSDKRGAFAVLAKENGSKVTDFRFRSYRIFPGKTTEAVFPSVRAESDVETLDLELFDVSTSCALHLYYEVYPSLDLIVRKSQLVNEGDATLTVEKLSSAQLDLPQKDLDLLSFGGGYAHEFTFFREPLRQGKKILDSSRGLSSHQLHPLAILAEKSADENQGFCLGFSFVYSGDFAFEFSVDEWGMTRFLGGVNPETFGYRLKAKESLMTPELVMAFSDQGFSKLTSSFYALTRDDVVRQEEKGLSHYVLLNSWEAYYFDFTTEKVLKAIDKAHEWGISLFVLDDGWFGKRNTDTCSLGDWTVNTEKIDLRKVIDHAHALGMAFGLWFEPEMVSYDSSLFRAHPDFASLDPSVTTHTLHRHQFLLDLTRDDVLAYLKSSLFAILSAYPVDYVKWDYNRDASEMALTDAECFRRYENVYRLLNEVVARFPRVYLETCAGGGGRFDLGMLSYSSRIWASDNQDAHDRSFIQYGASFFYPPEVVSAHVNRASDREGYNAKSAVAFFGTFGFELDPEIGDGEVVKEGVDLYQKYHKVLETGSLYRLLSPYVNGAIALESLSPDQKTIVLLFNPVSPHYSNTLALRGLPEKASYREVKTGKVYSAKSLAEAFPVSAFHDGDFSRLLFFEKI